MDRRRYGHVAGGARPADCRRAALTSRAQAPTHTHPHTWQLFRATYVPPKPQVMWMRSDLVDLQEEVSHGKNPGTQARAGLGESGPGDPAVHLALGPRLQHGAE